MMFAKIKPYLIGGVIILVVGGVVYKKAVISKSVPAEPLQQTPKTLESISGVGTLEAKEVVILAPKTTAKIQALYADEGDAVTRGQVLAKMDVAELNANVRESAALISKSRAQLSSQRAVIDDLKAKSDLADATLERYTALLKGGFVTQAEFDAAHASARSAKAQWKSAKENLLLFTHDIEKSEAVAAAQQEKIEDLTLRSPFEGIVLSRNAEAGSTVGAGNAVFRLADLKTVWAKIYVDEAQSGALKVGQRAAVTLRSQSKTTFEGEVVRIGVESDRITEERIVYIQLRTLPETLHIGEQVEARISTSQSGLGK
ncbi:efflux RND transporter periplasmic adaptor subunit [Sulfuricurvum sp.]|uniref:efflux RND transporter periplasmic adaptor subunit n=1 Tax=Sulfuricurvum sp. TaxID=2025608 RepID=UPI003C61138B